MAEHLTPGPVSDLNSIREAACIHTKKIYDSCQAKDCIENLQVYPTESSQRILDEAQSIKACSAKLLNVLIRVNPVNMNRGFYSIQLQFYYKITGEAYTGCGHSAPVTGIALFEKRAILFGSESSTKVFTSACSDECDVPLPPPADRPTATLEAVDPIVLDAIIRDCMPGPDPYPIQLPEAILSEFDEPIVRDCCDHRCLYVTLGQFSILRLERDAQLMIPVYDCCIPDKECCCDEGEKDPCELFQRVQFPVREFCPPDCSEELNPMDNCFHCCCK